MDKKSIKIIENYNNIFPIKFQDMNPIIIENNQGFTFPLGYIFYKICLNNLDSISKITSGLNQGPTLFELQTGLKLYSITQKIGLENDLDLIDLQMKRLILEPNYAGILFEENSQITSLSIGKKTLVDIVKDLNLIKDSVLEIERQMNYIQ